MSDADRIEHLTLALDRAIERCSNALCIVRDEDRGETFRQAVAALEAGRATLKEHGHKKLDTPVAP